MRTTSLALALVALAALAPASNAAISGPLVDWFTEAQKAVVAYGIPNQLSAKVYGILGVTQFRGLQEKKKSSAWKNVPDTAIAAFASHFVLSSFFPQRQSTIYDVLLANHTSGLDTATLNLAQYIGVTRTYKHFANRVPDLAATTWSRFTTPATPTFYGQYVATPGQTTFLYPQLANATPLILSASEVAAIAGKYHKLAISSAQYQNELAFVRDYGIKASAVRSQYDTDSAAFWADGGGTSAIGGHWLTIAYSVLPSTLTIYQQAQFFARFGAAIYDASIVTWVVKYSELFWRPVTALRNGDGINAPILDWTPLLGTPAHPEFPSGHQGTVGGALGALVATLGTETINFTVGTEFVPVAPAPPLAPRSYTSLRTAAVEVGDSRVFGGVHFNVSGVVGLNIGLDVAAIINAKITNSWALPTSGR